MTNGHSVLVVDDNVDSAESLRILLQCWGHSVELAHDGTEAIDRVERQRPDIVLLDLGLPGMDGLEVARQLRERLGDATPRLVAVTGYGREEDRRRTRAAGFTRHLLKPLDLDQLRAVLDTEDHPGGRNGAADDAAAPRATDDNQRGLGSPR